MVGTRVRPAMPDAIDELTFLAPWIVLPATTDRLHDFPGIGEIPTLRELARLEQGVAAGNRASAWIGRDARGERVADELRRLITEASYRAKRRIAAIERFALQSSELSRWSMTSGSTKRPSLAIGYNLRSAGGI